MTFKKGHYQINAEHTKYRAVVAQVASLGPNQWILRGAVCVENVCYIHTWDLHGRSHSGNPLFDLVEPK